MLFTIWIVFHVIVCVALVLVVLMQSSKGEGLAGSAFGGAGGVGGAVFGGRGAASFLSKATTVLAIVFMFNCGALAFMSSRSRVDASSPSQVEDSAITRQARQEYEQQMQRQQQQMADSIAATAGDTGQVIDLEQLMNEGSPESQDTASGQ